MKLGKEKTKILVTGAGGFIGGHLVNYLYKRGYKNIRAVDIKPLKQWQQVNKKAENLVFDLRNLDNCHKVSKNINEIYNLASNMGGMGFIESNKALCMLNVLINTNILLAAARAKVNLYFFSSSACIYPLEKQKNSKINGLKEAEAYPANPEDGYGWEKLFSERMCHHFMDDLA
jgi:nucleoside-diphosphate-sugar epimerase